MNNININDLSFSEEVCLNFLIYVAKKYPQKIPKQLETDLAVELAELEAEYILSLKPIKLSQALLSGDIYSSMGSSTFLTNLQYIRNQGIAHQSKLLEMESLHQYWTPIDLAKLLNEFIPLYTEI